LNSYCSIADLKSALGVTSTTDDTILRKIAEAASRVIDRYTNRYFYVESATKYFDGATRLWIPDLLAVTTLKTDEDADATYENTLTVTTDYLLYPLNTYPKTYIELGIDPDYGSFGGGAKRSVEIAGTWGYGDGISATPYIADTTISEDLTAGEAAVDVTATTNLSAGQTILIGTEQYFIYSISSSTLTTEPGVNGTTEATHTSGTTIYIYQYPYDVWQACIALSVSLYKNRDKHGLTSERLGDYEYMRNVTAYGAQGKRETEVILGDYISGYRKIRV